jgi:FdhD protein
MPSQEFIMIADTVKLPVIKIMGAEKQLAEDVIVREVPITIFFNKEEIVTILCSPSQIRELTVGFLVSEGFITNRDDLYTIGHHCEENVIRVEGRARQGQQGILSRRVISSCCGKNRVSYNFENDASLIRVQDSKVRITLNDAIYYANYLEQNSTIFRETGGTHNGGVGCDGRVSYTCYDIGRHNVLDKLMGMAILEKKDLSDHVLFFSGRVSSEILIKVAKMNIPVLIARSAPTDMTIALAEDLNITVIGFARDNRLNIYTCSERVRLPPLLCRDKRKDDNEPHEKMRMCSGL